MQKNVGISQFQYCFPTFLMEVGVERNTISRMFEFLREQISNHCQQTFIQLPLGRTPLLQIDESYPMKPFEINTPSVEIDESLFTHLLGNDEVWSSQCWVTGAVDRQNGEIRLGAIGKDRTQENFRNFIKKMWLPIQNLKLLRQEYIQIVINLINFQAAKVILIFQLPTAKDLVVVYKQPTTLNHFGLNQKGLENLIMDSNIVILLLQNLLLMHQLGDQDVRVWVLIQPQNLLNYFKQSKKSEPINKFNFQLIHQYQIIFYQLIIDNRSFIIYLCIV